jgi:hypothetical protein|tara:strand:- start:1847 stop:2149 length:303 start_codon:yes stop_codon:yes gene_type:complete
MATVTLLRNGKPTQVEVPTSFNTEDDCRIFLSYWKAQGATAWDTRVVGPFVEAFNSGTISLEEVVTLANGEIIAQSDTDWPISETELKEHITTNSLTLTR